MSAAAPTPVSVARPKVLLADDHVIFLEGLGTILQDRFDLVGLVNDGHALIESAKRLCPDVIVTDLSMPGLGGFDAIRLLRGEGCTAKFIALTMHAEVEMAAEAFRAGVSGYVLKQSASKELISAIEEVLCDRVYLTPMIAKDFISSLVENRPAFENQGKSKPVHLSPRQKQVLQLVSDGRTMKEVGNILNISSRTAEAHKYAIMQVLGAKTTAQLVQYASGFKIVST